MATKYRQISLNDSFSSCQDLFIEDTPSFFQLLDEHFNISDFIPVVFMNAFYQSMERKRLYPLTGFLSALILQKVFFHPFRFPSYPFPHPFQGTTGFLWLL